jgi:cytochrome oxidase Cu insertion factor (SCO1/SenC/PrrC family)
VEKLRAVDEAFRKEGRSFSVVILTLDPAVDTPERLQRFKRERGLPAHWHFFRGSDADTRALARALRVDPAFDVGHIDHNVRILVLDAGGYAARAFSGWDFAPDEAVVR